MHSLAEQLIQCRISKGIFPNEYAVEITSSSGQKVSFFTTQEYLESADLAQGTALLKVGVAEESPESPNMLVYLPQASLETGTHWVEIPKKQEMSLR